jgi:hypothetical protein
MSSDTVAQFKASVAERVAATADGCVPYDVFDVEMLVYGEKTRDADTDKARMASRGASGAPPNLTSVIVGYGSLAARVRINFAPTMEQAARVVFVDPDANAKEQGSVRLKVQFDAPQLELLERIDAKTQEIASARRAGWQLAAVFDEGRSDAYHMLAPPGKNGNRPLVEVKLTPSATAVELYTSEHDDPDAGCARRRTVGKIDDIKPNDQVLIKCTIANGVWVHKSNLKYGIKLLASCVAVVPHSASSFAPASFADVVGAEPSTTDAVSSKRKRDNDDDGGASDE